MDRERHSQRRVHIYSVLVTIGGGSRASQAEMCPRREWTKMRSAVRLALERQTACALMSSDRLIGEATCMELSEKGVRSMGARVSMDGRCTI